MAALSFWWWLSSACTCVEVFCLDEMAKNIGHGVAWLPFEFTTALLAPLIRHANGFGKGFRSFTTFYDFAEQFLLRCPQPLSSFCLLGNSLDSPYHFVSYLGYLGMSWYGLFSSFELAGYRRLLRRMTERYRKSVGIGMTFVPVHFLSMAVLWGRPAGWNKDIPSEHVFFF